jgi:hypothetical protein
MYCSFENCYHFSIDISSTMFVPAKMYVQRGVKCHCRLFFPHCVLFYHSVEYRKHQERRLLLHLLMHIHLRLYLMQQRNILDGPQTFISIYSFFILHRTRNSRAPLMQQRNVTYLMALRHFLNTNLYIYMCGVFI